MHIVQSQNNFIPKLVASLLVVMESRWTIKNVSQLWSEKILSFSRITFNTRLIKRLPQIRKAITLFAKILWTNLFPSRFDVLTPVLMKLLKSPVMLHCVKWQIVTFRKNTVQSPSWSISLSVHFQSTECNITEVSENVPIQTLSNASMTGETH